MESLSMGYTEVADSTTSGREAFRAGTLGSDRSLLISTLVVLC